MKAWLPLLFLVTGSALLAQPQKRSVVIGNFTTKPNALLILNPEHSDQGVLLPQLSSRQRLAMQPATPGEDGLMVFDLDLGAYFYWSQGKWTRLLNDATKKTGFQSIDPANFTDLKPASSTRHKHAAVFQSDNTFITGTREGRVEIIAPAEVPHGAAIREFTLFYLDSDEEEDIDVRFLRQSFDGETDTLVIWRSSGSSASMTTHTFDAFNNGEVIDRQRYSYRLLVGFENAEEVRTPEDARQRVYGARIKYEE